MISESINLITCKTSSCNFSTTFPHSLDLKCENVVDKVLIRLWKYLQFCTPVIYTLVHLLRFTSLKRLRNRFLTCLTETQIWPYSSILAVKNFRSFCLTDRIFVWHLYQSHGVQFKSSFQPIWLYISRVDIRFT